MSGIFALLDDVAAIAKVAAASIDDIATSTMKAGSKTVGILIDDAAVTPKYVTGLAPARELPIIRKIAIGSLRNKLLILLPLIMALQVFLPQVITPLLMVGGAFLCFEGAEKILHVIRPGHGHEAESDGAEINDPAKLEEQRVRGAISTDFILSAEIMVLSTSVIEADGFILKAITLAAVGTMITIGVYGLVALLVKIDDLGIGMARRYQGFLGKLGRGLVLGMPKFFTFLTIVGTAAMLWVGGNIVTHGLEVLGWPGIYDKIHQLAALAGSAAPAAQGFIQWLVTASLDGVFGLALGILVVPVVTTVIGPLIGRLKVAKTLNTA